MLFWLTVPFLSGTNTVHLLDSWRSESKLTDMVV